MGTAPDAFDGIHMNGEAMAEGSGGWCKPVMRNYVGGGTGEVEVLVQAVRVLNAVAGSLPFPVSVHDEEPVREEVRLRLLDLESGAVRTVDVGGVNVERGRMGPVWSPDSRWLAYAKTHSNSLRRVMAWSRDTGSVMA